jgi:Flp pilus assembly pilin Flp
MKLFKIKILSSSRGGGLIEYALLVSLISVVCLGSLLAFSNSIRKVYCEKIMQVAYLDNPRAGDIDIDWVPANGEDSAFCINNEAENDDGGVLF